MGRARWVARLPKSCGRARLILLRGRPRPTESAFRHQSVCRRYANTGAARRGSRMRRRLPFGIETSISAAQIAIYPAEAEVSISFRTPLQQESQRVHVDNSCRSAAAGSEIRTIPAVPPPRNSGLQELRTWAPVHSASRAEPGQARLGPGASTDAFGNSGTGTRHLLGEPGSDQRRHPHPEFPKWASVRFPEFPTVRSIDNVGAWTAVGIPV